MDDISKTAFDTRTTRKRKRTVPLAGKKPLYLAGIGVGIFIIVLLALTVSDVFASKNKICPGIILAGQNVGGFTKQEAAEILTAGEESLLKNTKVILKTANATTTISADQVDAVIDVEASVEKAFTYGKSDRFFKNVGAVLLTRFKKIPVTPVAKYDHLKLDMLLEEFSLQAGGSLRQHEIVVGEKDIVIKPGHSGEGIDIQSAREAFDNALATADEIAVTLPIKSAAPQPINIDQLYDSIYKTPQNAVYSKDGGALKVVPHVAGRDFDKENAKQMIAGITENGSNIVIRMRELAPEITTASLSAGLFKDVLGKQTSRYATSNVPRSTNVELAARYINGTIILPGEVFSYNSVVGQRTAARGFKNAAIYENNKMVDGMGGGICQVTSTLYGATLYADMETLERTCHSLEVSYVPLGTDATVVYGALDFKFKNNTNHPLRVNASASGGNLSVELVGTKKNPNRTIKITTQEVGTTPITMKEIQDPTLPAGKRVVTNKGFAGHVVNTYKVIYENGVEVENKFLHKSVYNMSSGEVRVGTGASEAQPASEPVDAGQQPSQIIPSSNPEPTATTPVATPGNSVKPSAAPTTSPASTPTSTPNVTPNTSAPPATTVVPSYPSGL